MTSISIIIPVLNEVSTITQTISTAQTAKDKDIEIIVVDGGSNDGTIELIKCLNIQIISSLPGRATQMNCGAKIATGKILLFLHGDTLLPSNFDRMLEEILVKPKIIAGAFELSIRGKTKGLRIVERMVNWRSRYLQMPYGDQGIFLPTKVFQEIGGFPEIPIMEDFELIRQLKKRGQIAIIPSPVFTSGRRWQKLGILKTTFINQIVIIAYLLGVSPKRLARLYVNFKD
ncbi:MAG: glycosyltransferase family 2 protein [Okeania sp. SIO2G4]|uniref:TIGR04283 family arsenosugar biosynthesis glycosyltransferase n=1 Tax=unclassified Okeania TaxID=2634635 RepID=UPI0013B5E97F|nr:MULTISPECIES: TIGR04283 family arsenosugar biosynthesis glycosyltransferase [unclassified Okeania]NEP06288.1 glycosyltransferase family 2 protein [Okeania sp. SIO4D6]NEP73610.1 glycosyltransferase family 2 protein [Okeania sp. SIO2G5]NEP97022.1 glycosyltransferase family 2 protein [Okeania sp. SIO2F5]NEQ90659.1 glycosyltransferase family 2 protein [Okeania sp. SIO2G4]